MSKPNYKILPKDVERILQLARRRVFIHPEREQMSFETEGLIDKMRGIRRDIERENKKLNEDIAKNIEGIRETIPKLKEIFCGLVKDGLIDQEDAHLAIYRINKLGQYLGNNPTGE